MPKVVEPAFHPQPVTELAELVSDGCGRALVDVFFRLSVPDQIHDGSRKLDTAYGRAVLRHVLVYPVPVSIHDHIRMDIYGIEVVEHILVLKPAYLAPF